MRCAGRSLVNEIVPRDQLIPRAEAILRQIGANAPLAVKFALEAVNKGLEGTLDEGLLIEASLFALCAATEEKKKGLPPSSPSGPPIFRADEAARPYRQ